MRGSLPNEPAPETALSVEDFLGGVSEIVQRTSKGNKEYIVCSIYPMKAQKALDRISELLKEGDWNDEKADQEIRSLFAELNATELTAQEEKQFLELIKLF